MSGYDDISRATVELTAVIITMRDGEPCVLAVDAPDRSALALPSGPLQSGHRTLQAGVRSWVEKQTGQELGYVEQLYTFGDRHGRALSVRHHRTISIAYLALVCSGDDAASDTRPWRRWYAFFPWEDHRSGRPLVSGPLLRRLGQWARKSGRLNDPDCRERVGLTFGIGDTPWDEERALERYEMLYEADLVPEAASDRGDEVPATKSSLAGVPMFSDHRRILATAISRIRAKIKYRPVLFELMPASFTLLQLQKTAEALSGMSLHKQNFRRLIAQQSLVEETGELAVDTGGRPAKLVRFRKEATLEQPTPGVRLKATRRGAYP